MAAAEAGFFGENFLANPQCPPFLKDLETQLATISHFRASKPRQHFQFRLRFLCFQTANRKIQI